MAIMAKDSGRDFTPAPEGLQRAVCADVVDLGMEESQWGAKHKVRVYWQLEERDEDGRRFIVVKKYTLSLHRKSSLCADLTSWRGRPFNEEEKLGFDLERLVGINAQIQIVHNPGNDGSVWSNVQAVVGPPKGVEPLKVEDYTRKKDREGYEPPADPFGDSATEPEPEDEDGVPF